MNKSYWIFQWCPSKGYCDRVGFNPRQALKTWSLDIQVFEESAYRAARTAAICTQRALGVALSDPVDPEHIKLRQVDLPDVWCMPHDQGSCIHRYNDKLDREWALSWVGAKRPAPTACGYYVHDVESIALGLPTCPLCLIRLIQQHDPKVLTMIGYVDENRQKAIATLAGAWRTQGRSKRPKALTKHKAKGRPQRGKRR